MDDTRRKVLKDGGLFGLMGFLASNGVGLIAPSMAAEVASARNTAAFEAVGFAKTLEALGVKAAATGDVTLQVPEIAENGAVVPMVLTSALPEVDMMAILIEKNPLTLIAIFEIPADTEANIQTRCKMAQTSNVMALVRSNGKFFTVSKEVKVTLGGCGG